LSIVFGAIGLFASPLVIYGVMQAKGEVAELATGYLQIAMGGAYSIFFLLQITAILRAYGHSKTAAVLLVSGNVLNVVLNLVLVYGPGPTPEYFAFAQPVAVALGIPRMGLNGTAWATLIGRTVPVIFGLIVLWRTVRGDRSGFSMFHPEWRMLSRLVKIGWPSSAQLVVRIGAILVFLSLINSNYTTDADAHTLTAYSICLRLETLVLFLGMGWGAAASTYVGTNLGAKQRTRAHRAGWIAASYNAVLTAVMVALFIEYSDPILGFFEHSPDVLASGREYLTFVAPSYVLVAIGVVLSQALTGAGATLASLVLDASVLVLAVVPAAIVVTEAAGAPPVGLWVTMAVGNAVIAAVFAVYYAKGKFLDKRI
jgi:putative MATE family efflux protein